jgi:hypothetical protein
MLSPKLYPFRNLHNVFKPEPEDKLFNTPTSAPKVKSNNPMYLLRSHRLIDTAGVQAKWPEFLEVHRPLIESELEAQLQD